MKLGHHPQSVVDVFIPNKDVTSHLLRQFASILLVVTLALGVMVGTALIAGQDPPGAAQSSRQDSGDESQDEDDDEKKATPKRDVKHVNELDLSPAELAEIMRGTRPHRKPIPGLLESKPLECETPTPEKLRRFGELRKRGIEKPEDEALIDEVVRYQVYSLSDPSWYRPKPESGRSAFDQMKKNRDAIEQTLGLEAKGGANETFLTTYKRSAIKYLTELLDNHIWVRINAMMLIGQAREEELIRLFVAQIQSPDQHESVKFIALENIGLLAQRNPISKVELESMAVAALLDVLDQSDKTHPRTRQAAVRALGAIGRPTRVVGRNDTDVAVALLKIVRDPNIRRLDRSEAVVALANLKIPAEIDYNFQYVTYEIAGFVADVGGAAVQNPSTDDLHSHIFLVDASVALDPQMDAGKPTLVDKAKKHARAKSHGDPAYVTEYARQIYRLTVAALKSYKPEAVTTGGKAAPPPKDDLPARTRDIRERLKGEFATQLDTLNNMLRSKPPRSMKLSPDTQELGPPPTLAGPSIPPSTDAADAATEGKDEAEANSRTAAGPEQ